MKSVLSQMKYAFPIRKWVERGVPFNYHVYVPEDHPVTECTYYEHELT